jgi:hypothetical protein
MTSTSYAGSGGVHPRASDQRYALYAGQASVAMQSRVIQPTVDLGGARKRPDDGRTPHSVQTSDFAWVRS